MDMLVDECVEIRKEGSKRVRRDELGVQPWSTLSLTLTLTFTGRRAARGWEMSYWWNPDLIARRKRHSLASSCERVRDERGLKPWSDCLKEGPSRLYTGSSRKMPTKMTWKMIKYTGTLWRRWFAGDRWTETLIWRWKMLRLFCSKYRPELPTVGKQAMSENGPLITVFPPRFSVLSRTTTRTSTWCGSRSYWVRSVCDSLTYIDGICLYP